MNYALYFSLYKMRNRSPCSTRCGWMSKILTEYLPALRVRQEVRLQPLPPLFPRCLNKINVTQKNCNSLYKNQVPGRAVLIWGYYRCDKACSESRDSPICLLITGFAAWFRWGLLQEGSCGRTLRFMHSTNGKERGIYLGKVSRVVVALCGWSGPFHQGGSFVRCGVLLQPNVFIKS